MAFSVDGKTLASVSADGTVKLWDAATGAERARLPGHDRPVSCLAFTPDGETLVTGTGVLTYAIANPLNRFFTAEGFQEGEVKVWDLKSRKEKATLKAHGSGVLSLAVGTDGKTLATAGADGAVKLWDLSRGGDQEPVVVGQHPWPVMAVALDADGKTLAAGTWDRVVKLWDVTTRTERATLHGHGGPIFALAFARDGKTLASASFDRTVKLWDLATGTERGGIRGHTGFVWSVTYSTDGKMLATAGGEGLAKIWDMTRPQESLPFQDMAGGLGGFVALTPDGQQLAATWGNRAVTLRQVAKRDKELLWKKEVAHAGWITSIATPPKGTLLATGSWDRTVKLWDLATGDVKATLEGHTGQVWSVSFAPDGKTLASAGGEDGTVRLWDVDDRKELAVLQAQGGPFVRCVAFSPDGKTLGLVSVLPKKAIDAPDRATVELWDVSSRKLSKTFHGHKGGIDWLAFAPGGKLLATGSWDRTAKLWDLDTLEERAVLQGHIDVVYGGTFSPDGRTLATASWDGTVKLWHVATGQELITLRGFTRGAARCVAFSPDGTVLAVTSGWGEAEEVTLFPAEAAQLLKIEDGVKPK